MVFWFKRLGAFALLSFAAAEVAAASGDASSFHKEIKPLLEKYCWDCHGDGMDKGKVSFDTFKSDQEMLEKKDLWLHALKNVRAGIMPPAKKPRPSKAEIEKLGHWVKHDVFAIDPRNP
ncbi:MAG TPA: c-type cytochrome domain-containing protein, partial [Verrucomicrobiae bacterium]|nr:c-type cytochrome domain-containing protein [Verrucomicrobiae bacterium]